MKLKTLLLVVCALPSVLPSVAFANQPDDPPVPPIVESPWVRRAPRKVNPYKFYYDNCGQGSLTINTSLEDASIIIYHDGIIESMFILGDITSYTQTFNMDEEGVYEILVYSGGNLVYSEEVEV